MASRRLLVHVVICAAATTSAPLSLAAEPDSQGVKEVITFQTPPGTSIVQCNDSSVEIWDSFANVDLRTDRRVCSGGQLVETTKDTVIKGTYDHGKEFWCTLPQGYTLRVASADSSNPDKMTVTLPQHAYLEDCYAREGWLSIDPPHWFAGWQFRPDARFELLDARLK